MTYAEIQAEKSVLRVENNWCLARKSLSLLIKYEKPSTTRRLRVSPLNEDNCRKYRKVKLPCLYKFETCLYT